MTLDFPRNGGHRGFTLLEMMLVLLILSTMSALFLTARIADMQDQQKQTTIQRMAKLQKQLEWFRTQYCRLPCPTGPTLTIASRDYGYEQTVNGDAGPGPCDASGNVMAHGAPPAKSLGMTDKEMYDGDGRKFEYMVVQSFTTAGSFPAHPVTPTGYTGLTVDDASGNQITNQALYVLASYGDSGQGGYLESGQRYAPGNTDVNALADCHCSTAGVDTSLSTPFVDATASETAATPNKSFGVILRYAQRENLKSSADLSGTAEVCASSGGGTTGSSTGSTSGGSTTGSSGGSTTSGTSGSSGGSSSGGSSSSSGSSSGSTSSSGGSSGADEGGGGSTSSTSSGGCNNYAAGQSCVFNSDCATGTICVGSTCTSCGSPPYPSNCRCAADSDCASVTCEGQGTCGAACAPGSGCTPPSPCTDSSQCLFGNQCVSGSCTSTPCGSAPYPDDCSCIHPGTDTEECSGGYCNITVGACHGVCGSSPTSGGVSTSCCPGVLVPSVLHATVSGGCTCINGTYTIINGGGANSNDWSAGTVIVTCNGQPTNYEVGMFCNGTGWQIESAFGGTPGIVPSACGPPFSATGTITDGVSNTGGNPCPSQSTTVTIGP